MKYSNIIEHIFQAFPMYHKQGSAAYKEGLENIETLADMAKHPEKRFLSVHIAGTNGKGSVAHLLASWFQELGYKTGLYTSPHLMDFRERIKINGQMIAEEDVIAFFDQHHDPISQIEPSFFEITTMLAFDYFAKKEVDIAIIEVGLGGRLDATNIITPELSVITNISLDHTQLLGNTLAAIAAEKGGIIKHHVPVVVGEYHPETYPVFQQIAQQKQAPIFLAEERFSCNFFSSNTIEICQKGKPLFPRVEMPLLGEYQRKNIATFLQAVSCLTPKFNPQNKQVEIAAIEHLMDNTGLMGRWQIIKRSPLTIADVGHNVGGLSLAMKQLSEIATEKLHIIIGFVNDKDIVSIIPLLPKKAKYYLCQATIERALSATLLAPYFGSHSLDFKKFKTVPEAYQTACQAANNEDVIFVGGSCFVVGDFLKILY
ncbi:MAG: bifunctional folylpolyglutamate synthase/dihydrofolate synthase [Bacteroidales bacterium]|jgi:dihydrofolate synthase/folylpolyglutamate synthase|nr:bifunctional folylpolyglutamate synthase/dihydrofolate synthase [Bacteroidales bacterium]